MSHHRNLNILVIAWWILTKICRIVKEIFLHIHAKFHAYAICCSKIMVLLLEKRIFIFTPQTILLLDRRICITQQQIKNMWASTQIAIKIYKYPSIFPFNHVFSFGDIIWSKKRVHTLSAMHALLWELPPCAAVLRLCCFVRLYQR